MPLPAVGSFTAAVTCCPSTALLLTSRPVSESVASAGLCATLPPDTEPLSVSPLLSVNDTAPLIACPSSASRLVYELSLPVCTVVPPPAHLHTPPTAPPPPP